MSTMLITIRSDVQVERNFRTAFNSKHSSGLPIRRWLKKYIKTASVLQQMLHESMRTNGDNLGNVRESPCKA